MAKEAKQVLDELCTAILKSSRDDLPQLLEWSRELYEQLVVMHYLYTHPVEYNEKQETSTEENVYVSTDVTNEIVLKNEKSNKKQEVESVIQSDKDFTLKFEDEHIENKIVKEKIEKSTAEKNLYVGTDNVGKVVYAEIKQEKIEVSLSDSGMALNERLAATSKIALGLNDKIAFSRHLFNGNDAALSALIDVMNGAQTFEQAMNYLHQARAQFGHWDEKKEFVTRLENLVRRKFGKPEILED
ncbi:hypothetical protein JCM31826_00060 [Thermaurantimonas aggregans]|uniref:Uncharacterized protein n=1 Tax=Thermaurantimonas aggregans TaxID=2173829 RepID=A0A401XHQ7_9FLAO|nr:hypothetical protein [Thermaurantimonas aggregans]MCX8149822.1 hypothetical protein [Thermaurantimonas aggregans]GCD76524.1 hypothetical protein JCM31826_00060 [Thermaurantimonas aggregans]